MKKYLTVFALLGIATAVFADNLAESTIFITHEVTSGGLELTVPVTIILMPAQEITRGSGDIAYLAPLEVHTFELKVLDMRGTLSPITVRASVEPLTNGNFVRETTVIARNFGGPNGNSGLTATQVVTKLPTVEENFINATPLLNRSFVCEVGISAEALSGQNIATGLYQGSLFLEVN